MNDSANQNQQPISDDQELAKVLQGMQQQTRSMATSDPNAKEKQSEQSSSVNALNEESRKNENNTGVKQNTGASTPQLQPTVPSPVATPVPANDKPAEPASTSTPQPVEDVATKPLSPTLENLKKEALEELRPLVNKLDLPAKEKFDTMLLIIRSTDDQSLLQPAHQTAKTIEDENERAEALLDIVKEVDYFAGQKPA